MNQEHLKQFPEFYTHYKSAYTIFAQYQCDGKNYSVDLEIRKGAKNGCELFTTINGKAHHFFSRSFRGCTYQMFDALPKGTIIVIPHQVSMEVDDLIEPLVVIEEIYCELSATINDPSIVLSCDYHGHSIRTQAHEADEINEALFELKNKLNGSGIVVRICPNCRFLDQYANTEICLRDLPSDEFDLIQKTQKRQKDLTFFYDKIAWDIDTFHFCPAFSKR